MGNNSGRTTNKKSGRERLAQSLKLPGDVLMGDSIVTLTGNREAWIENYRGIIEYSETLILLQGKTCQICFEGTGLSINYYTNEDMKIGGCIKSVTYQ